MHRYSGIEVDVCMGCPTGNRRQYMNVLNFVIELPIPLTTRGQLVVVRFTIASPPDKKKGNRSKGEMGCMLVGTVL